MNLQLGDTQLIIAEAKKQGLLRNQLAYVLGTGFWETGKTMKPVEEAYYLKDKAEAYRKKNLRYYPYYGRGYVQLTWDYNYEKYGIKDNPAKALEPSFAAYVLVDGMKNGVFTGKKLSNYITLSKSDFKNARRIVNGMDQAELIAEFARQYDKDLLAIGYGVTGTERPAESVPAPEVTEPTTQPKRSTLELIISILLKLFAR